MLNHFFSPCPIFLHTFAKVTEDEKIEQKRLAIAFEILYTGRVFGEPTYSCGSEILTYIHIMKKHYFSWLWYPALPLPLLIPLSSRGITSPMPHRTTPP